MGKINKTDQIIDELEKQLFIVEGEVTDLLTSYSMQNLNANMQNGTGAVAIGSAILGQVGNAALSHMTTSDEGIEVSDFAIELTDQHKVKHYFIGCFPEVIFKKNDQVKVIAEPHNEKYAHVVAIIDPFKNYIWTGQQITNGRMRYRIFGMKLMGGIVLFSTSIFIIFFLFLEDGLEILLDPMIHGILFFCIALFLFGGWRLGVSFDQQSLELEAILKRVGFFKPTMASLNSFSVFAVNRKNKVKLDEIPERWEQYTYRIDLAKQQDEEKYGKNK